MYNPNQINPFFKRVHEEASKAAQEVYNKHTPELIQRIKNQMGEGHEVYSGMGSCVITNAKNEKLDNDFDQTLADNTQYHTRNLEAGFYIPSSITKP